MAVEQGGAERGFEVGQPLADGRCRNEFALRRAPDAAQFAHGHEQLQRREVDAAGEVAFGRAHGVLGLGIASGDELAIFFLFLCRCHRDMRWHCCQLAKRGMPNGQ
jgi:hypothetical protein